MSANPFKGDSSMKICWLAAVALMVLLVAGCGNDGGETGSAEGTQASAQETGAAEEKPQGLKLDKRDANEIAAMWVAMDGWDSAETVSFLMAEKRGYFGKLKISPLTLSPVTPKLTIPDVVRGQDVLGVAPGPEAVAARDKGEPIVIVGDVLRQATAALIWTKESGIGGVAGLKGKTVAIPGLSSQMSLLQNALTEGGLEPADVKVIGVGNDLVPALVKGRADAIFGGSANVEGIDLKSRGFQPVVTPVTALGVPDYDELVLVARQDVAEANPKLIKDFVSALARGASAAREKPQEATEVLDASGEKNPEISPSARQEQVDATVGMLSGSGYVDPARLQHLIDWMYEQEIIESKLQAAELISP
jgi:putative hydroxymethylpyrimidine transport system substrate-binding protein